jgi:hypothetical protein
VIHNTVCSLLLRESKIYREIAVVNMWWMDIIVVALLAFGIYGFVSLVRFHTQRLTSETTRRAEDMYDPYADSPRKRHRRSLASRRYCPVLPHRVPDSPLRFAALVGPGLWPGVAVLCSRTRPTKAGSSSELALDLGRGGRI